MLLQRTRKPFEAFLRANSEAGMPGWKRRRYKCNRFKYSLILRIVEDRFLSTGIDSSEALMWMLFILTSDDLDLSWCCRKAWHLFYSHGHIPRSYVTNPPTPSIEEMQNAINLLRNTKTLIWQLGTKKTYKILEKRQKARVLHSTC